MRPAALLLLLAACGGNSTAPAPTMSGTWITTWPHMTDGTNVCSVTATLRLAQSGATFSGTYSVAPGVAKCNGVSTDSVGGTGTIINGTVAGTTITFDVDEAPFHQTGTFDATSASGEALWSSGGVVVLSGPWSATR